MYLSKLPHPENFRFAEAFGPGRFTLDGEHFALRVTEHAGGICRLQVENRRWLRRESQARLTPPRRLARVTSLRYAPRFAFAPEGGPPRLEGEDGGCFGVSEAAWLLRFLPRPATHFFGLGEKWGALEKSGEKTRFYNTDVWADFPIEAIRAARADPLYASIPYLVVERRGVFFGVLLDTSYPAFMALDASFDIHTPRGATPKRYFYVGAEGGRPDVYLLFGPTLAELTQKLQRLVGTTPRPPLWALGHHQSRWGYGSYRDLAALDRKLREHAIPCDGLWLDIDYMDRFKVFTFDRRHFRAPRRELKKLAARGRHVVAIVDPGVKREPGYPVYDAAIMRRYFCETPAGRPFVGFVWPGETHFPDFSRPAVRNWWADHVARFVAHGLDGLWIDMNEPSLGAVEPGSMRFGPRRAPHASYHNQYALGMAMATREGLRRAAPELRPFLISRSASLSMARYAAVWTGDNYSNEAHLAASIPTTLNLALSGIPWNGADVAGFGGDTDDDVMLRWYKAAFLFPFFRNHSATGTRAQEPWAFSRRTLRGVRRYVRLRYRLLPYLYNLFIDQERRGEAILRPLFYDFPSTRALRLERVEDQFMVGPSLLHAPCLSRARPRRRVTLPRGHWFDATHGGFVAGGRRILARDAPETTPLFVRDGSVVPMQSGERESNHNDLFTLELHLFVRRGRVEYAYEADDGISYAYTRGITSGFCLSVDASPRALTLRVTEARARAGACTVSFVLHGPARRLALAGRELALRRHPVTLTGRRLDALKSEPVVIR